MGKIATEKEVYETAGGVLNTTKCCTKARVEALGCQIKTGYGYHSNQLIEVGSFEKKPPTYVSIDILNDSELGLPVTATVSVYIEGGEIRLDQYSVQAGYSTNEKLDSSKEWIIQIKCQGILEGAPYKIQLLNPGGSWSNGNYYDAPGAQCTDSLRRWYAQGFIAFRLIAK